MIKIVWTLTVSVGTEVILQQWHENSKLVLLCWLLLSVYDSSSRLICYTRSLWWLQQIMNPFSLLDLTREAHQCSTSPFDSLKTLDTAHTHRDIMKLRCLEDFACLCQGWQPGLMVFFSSKSQREHLSSLEISHQQLEARHRWKLKHVACDQQLPSFRSLSRSLSDTIDTVSKCDERPVDLTRSSLDQSNTYPSCRNEKEMIWKLRSQTWKLVCESSNPILLPKVVLKVCVWFWSVPLELVSNFKFRTTTIS